MKSGDCVRLICTVDFYVGDAATVDPKILWLFALCTGSITANTSLLKVITDDKLRRPNLTAGLINTLWSIVGGTVCYYFLDIPAAIAFVVFNAVSFLLLFYVVTKRDKKAVLFAERLLPTFQVIDLQIAFILSEISQGGGEELIIPIRRALRYVLSEIPIVFGFDSSHHIRSCILIPGDFKFSVVAYSSIPNYKVKRMAELFQYGPNPVSIAGRALNEHRTIIINDLTDQQNPETQYWAKITNDDSKEGSLLAHPIFRGIGLAEGEPLAVLCVTSRLKNAFDVKEVSLLLTYFSLKIEILQNSWEIALKKKEA